jgi:hypothetical protein
MMDFPGYRLTCEPSKKTVCAPPISRSPRSAGPEVYFWAHVMLAMLLDDLAP